MHTTTESGCQTVLAPLDREDRRIAYARPSLTEEERRKRMAIRKADAERRITEALDEIRNALSPRDRRLLDELTKLRQLNRTQ
jgi:hypothetical protein